MSENKGSSWGKIVAEAKRLAKAEVQLPFGRKAKGPADGGGSSGAGTAVKQRPPKGRRSKKSKNDAPSAVADTQQPGTTPIHAAPKENRPHRLARFFARVKGIANVEIGPPRSREKPKATGGRMSGKKPLPRCRRKPRRLPRT